MLVSHCWKRSFVSQAVLCPRQDAGTFVFGPGGQAAIVPPNVQDPTPRPTISTQATSAESSRHDGQPTSDLGTPVSSVVLSSLNPPSVATTTISVTSSVSPIAPTSTTPSSTLPTTSSSPQATSSSIPTSTPASQSASTPLAVATSSGSSNDVTDSSNHSVPFYVGVILGTIVVFSCLSTLVAWGIRVYFRSKRRRAFVRTFVPWGKPPGNDDGLEEGQDTVYFGTRHVRGDGSMHSWEPTGDRDVGEPRRGSSIDHSPLSPIKRPFVPPFADPPYQPGVFYAANSTPSFPQLADSIAYPLPLPQRSQSPYPTARPIPNHQDSSDSDIQSSAQSLGPLQVANLAPGDMATSRPGTAFGVTTSQEYFGTPREPIPGSKPRFLALDGIGLDVPWAPDSNPPTGMNDDHVRHNRSSRVSTRSESSQNRRYGELWMEGWTQSLRQNLVNAVDQVKNNFTSGSQTEDHLTPAPRRIAQQRQSPDHSGWGEHLNGRLVKRPLKREITASSTSSQLSKSWTLEETGDGAGVVHFRGLEGYTGCDGAWNRPNSDSEDGREGTLGLHESDH